MKKKHPIKATIELLEELRDADPKKEIHLGKAASEKLIACLNAVHDMVVPMQEIQRQVGKMKGSGAF